MPRDSERLIDMLTAARRIRSRIQNASRDKFDADEDLQIVAGHLIQVIGEAGATSQTSSE